MAQDINNITIIGRLGKDVQVKYTSSGFAIGNFSIANTRTSKKGEAWVDETNWFNVCLLGKSAENLSSYLTKGQQVCINGSLKFEEWEKEGSKQSRVVIVCSNIQLIGGKRELPREAVDDSKVYQNREAANQGNVEQPSSFGFDEDIPF